MLADKSVPLPCEYPSKLFLQYSYKNARCDSRERDNPNNCKPEFTGQNAAAAFDGDLNTFSQVHNNWPDDDLWVDLSASYTGLYETVHKVYVYGRGVWVNRALNTAVTLNNNSVVCTSNDVQDYETVKSLIDNDPPLPFVFDCEPTQAYNIRISTPQTYLAIREVEIYGCTTKMFDHQYAFSNDFYGPFILNMPGGEKCEGTNSTKQFSLDFECSKDNCKEHNIEVICRKWPKLF